MNPQDLTVVIVLLLTLGYGFVIGRSRVVAALLGIYTGYALGALIGPELGEWLVQRGVINQNATPWLMILLLLLPMILFIYRFDVQAVVGRQKGITSHFLTAVFSFLVAALALTLVLQQLVIAGQSWQDGVVAARLIDLRWVWVSLPLVLWGVLSFLRR